MRILFPLEARYFNRFRGRAQRLGTMALSAMLKPEGFKVELVKATPKAIATALSDDEPAVLAYSLTSQLADPILAVNREIKQRFDVLSFFGGPHPTYYPEVLGEEGVDAICRGQGEEAIVEMAGRIRDGRDYSDVRNWEVKREGTVFKNPLRPLIDNLDDLPFPDRDIMPNEELNSVMTSRGCPYNCTYCLNAAYKRLYSFCSPGKVRRRSVDSVIEELHRIKSRFPRTFIVFLDPILPIRKEWVEPFAREYRKHIGLPFFCEIKYELMDEEMVKLLKDAGCYSVGVGIESSNPEVREKLMRRHVSNEKIVTVSEQLHKAGIKMNTFNIIGMPQTTLYDDFNTLKFNQQIKADFATGCLLNPYRKSEIYDICDDLGVLTKDVAFTRGTFAFTTIEYGDQKLKRQLINLESLFTTLAQSTFLCRHAGFITKLRLGKLYAKFFSVGYAFLLRWRIFPTYLMRRLKGV